MLAGCSQLAFGHGVPIDVSLHNDHLIVLHTQDTRFAPPIFGQSDAYDDFSEADFFPGLGNLILWDIPGLDIEMPGATGSLQIEVIARPVIGTAGERRNIWYWDPETELVEQSPADFHLLNSEGDALTLQSENHQQMKPFLMASTLQGETGFHNHTLLLYGLDDDDFAPAGVYGFFGRLIYNDSVKSDPFLILFNYFTSNSLLDEAGLAIHAEGTLPGDFDLDDKVDGRDFLMWQRLFGSTTRTVADISLNGVVDAADLAIWQSHYGGKFGSLSAFNATQVPEPTACLMILAMTMSLATVRCRLSLC